MRQSSGVLLKEVAVFLKCPLKEASLCFYHVFKDINSCTKHFSHNILS